MCLNAHVSSNMEDMYNAEPAALHLRFVFFKFAKNFSLKERKQNCCKTSQLNQIFIFPVDRSKTDYFFKKKKKSSNSIWIFPVGIIPLPRIFSR